MDTLHQPPDIHTDPQAATPYFLRRRAEFAEVLEAEAARRGLGPDPLAA